MRRKTSRGFVSRHTAVAAAIGASLLLLVVACETIPYSEKAEKTVASYGDAADRHIVAVVTAWKNCQAQDIAEENCVEARYSTYEATFYDEWESKLFSAQQQAAAGDVFGICAKAGAMARDYANGITDAVLKEEMAKIDFSDEASCSLGTVGGVLQQHRNLRAFHEEFVVIEKDEAQIMRETIAQSVRIALTVENFKKAAASTPQ